MVNLETRLPVEMGGLTHKEGGGVGGECGWVWVRQVCELSSGFKPMQAAKQSKDAKESAASAPL